MSHTLSLTKTERTIASIAQSKETTTMVASLASNKASSDATQSKNVEGPKKLTLSQAREKLLDPSLGYGTAELRTPFSHPQRHPR